MRKSAMLSLEKGMQIQHKRNGQVLTVVAVQEDKIVCEERTISVSNCTRWFDILVEEPVQPVEPTIIVDNTQGNEIQGEQDTTPKKHVISRDTATTNTLNSIVETHRCKLQRMKEYIKVSREGVKRTLVYVRTPKGTGYHFDVSKKTWNKLTSEYQTYLIEHYGASIVDSSRGLWRIANCKELDVFEVLLLTALKIA